MPPADHPVRKFPRSRPPRLSKADVKALVRHRDGYCCTQCGMTARDHLRRYGRTLDVHRLIPGSRYSVKGCVSLCRGCHAPKPKSPRGTASVRMARIKSALLEQAQILADRDATTITEVVNRAVREMLEREGRWPPPHNLVTPRCPVPTSRTSNASGPRPTSRS